MARFSRIADSFGVKPELETPVDLLCHRGFVFSDEVFFLSIP